MAIKENTLPIGSSSGTGTYVRTVSSGGESQRTPFDTFKRAITEDIDDALDGKVDKVTGKGLSTNDFTTAEKNKLAGIQAGAQVNPTIDSALSESSTNPVQNKVVTEAVFDLKEDLYDLYDYTDYTPDYWLQGVWGAWAGAYDSNHSEAICLADYIGQTVHEIRCDSTLKMRLQAWENDVYIGCWNGTTFVVQNPSYFKTAFNIHDFRKQFPNYDFRLTVFASDGSSSITPANGELISYYAPRIEQLDTSVSNIQNQMFYDETEKMTWENGSIYAAGGDDYDGVMRAIRTPSSKMILLNQDMIFATRNSNIVLAYGFKYTVGGAYVGRLDYNDFLFLEAGYFYRFVLFAETGTEIAVEDIPEYSADTYLFDKQLYDVISCFDDVTSESNYSIDNLFNKTLYTATQIGSITRGQSFLKYNNYYYSINGNVVTKQDENFNEVQTVTLYTGHGNSFQLGSQNVAYASGWDDQKIYCVDLDTLTIIDTITLPTVGYTTCAVDDVNKIAYVFQRDTRPNTEDYYNFIKYDYENEIILYTTKVNVQFGAMQAVDYFNDTILVLYGLGTSELPSGLYIFDTNGKINGRYVLDVIKSGEPEGICVERETGDILFSMGDLKVYKIAKR